MLSFRSQIFISTIFGLISIATAQLGAGCPEAYGVQTYPDEKYCDRFYKVTITLGYYVDILRIQILVLDIDIIQYKKHFYLTCLVHKRNID